MSTDTSNQWEIQNRAAKVIAMSQRARQAKDGQGYTSAELEEFTDGQWLLLARAAGREDASLTTQRMVIEVVRGMEAEQARDDDEIWEGL